MVGRRLRGRARRDLRARPALRGPADVHPADRARGARGHVARLRTGAPDARLESTGERLSDGRFVAVPAKLLGTHTGALGEFPPTKRAIVVQTVLYCELDEDRTRLWRVRAFFDLYDAAIQLGVLPKPGSAGARALLMLRGFGLRPAPEPLLRDRDRAVLAVVDRADVGDLAGRLGRELERVALLQRVGLEVRAVGRGDVVGDRLVVRPDDLLADLRRDLLGDELDVLDPDGDLVAVGAGLGRLRRRGRLGGGRRGRAGGSSSSSPQPAKAAPAASARQDRMVRALRGMGGPPGGSGR